MRIALAHFSAVWAAGAGLWGCVSVSEPAAAPTPAFKRSVAPVEPLEPAGSAETASVYERSGALQGVGMLSQGQLLQVVASLEAAEIAQGQLAMMRARSDAVRAFARDLVHGHVRAYRQLQRFSRTRSDVELAASASSLELEDRSEALVGRLAALDNDVFDRAYMSAEVQAHRQSLRLLRRKLLPACDAGSAACGELATIADMMHRHLERGQLLLTNVTR